MGIVALLGRVLFSLIFILSGFGHFQPATMAYAAQHGVPAAHVLVPLSGVLAIACGLSVLLGLWARLGAVGLIVFLVPVTLTMHDFWHVADPMMRQMQRVNFLKNVALTGGALLIAYFGAGALSVDAWLRQRRGVRRVEVGPPTLTPTEAV